MMKRTLIFLLPLIILAGCRSKNSFNISGVVANPDSLTLLLKKVNVNLPVIIDSAKVGKNGKFNFGSIKATEPDFDCSQSHIEHFLPFQSHPIL